MDLSNKSLAFILVVAIVISLGGTIISLDKINTLNGRAGLTGFATSNASGTTNFSLLSNVIIQFTVANVDFGAGYVNTSAANQYCEIATNGTFNTSPNNFCLGSLHANNSPLVVANVGNINVSLDLNASANASVFINGTNPWFQWMTNYTNASCPGTASLNGSWSNVTVGAPTSACTNFLFTPPNNTAQIHIRIMIPWDAAGAPSGPGEHTATITAQGTA
jgi:hypothetical protein